jgi:CRP-like cAMP-binding protein
MIIDEKLLIASKTELITLSREEDLFSVGDIPQNYFQVKSGCLKVINEREGNRQFIHDFSNAGDPVGETFLFTDNPYNITAIALNVCSVYALPRETFYKFLLKYPNIQSRLIQHISDSANYRMTLINQIAYSEPRQKIIAVIDHFKMLKKHRKKRYEVPFTRQQLASLTGLRVETVIRTVKTMEVENIVKIIDGKIFI